MSEPFALANLPDDVLVQVIARLPVEEQLRIGRVSTRFHRLMTRALRYVNTLTVVLDGHYQMYQWYGETLSPDMASYIELEGRSEGERDVLLGNRRFDSKVTLRFSSEAQPNLEWLTTSMPYVRKFMFVQNGGNWYVDQVATLLDNWSSTLVSLTFLLDPYTRRLMSTEHSTRLFSSINALARLQDLFLEFMHSFDSNRLDLPILGQLRKFHFYSKDVSNELLLTSLRQYVLPGNRAMQQILLGQGGTEQPEGQYMPDYLRLDRCITSKVTALYNCYETSEQDGPMVDLLCSKFTSLTYLKLRVISQVYTPAQLVSALSHLAQLYYLDLDLSSATKMRISAQAPNRDRKALPSGPRLASVQVLVINYGRSYNHRALSHIFKWSHSFPGLRVVQVVDTKFRECVRCHVQKLRRGHAAKPGFKEVSKRPRVCIRKLTASFRRCPLIRKLMLEYPDKREVLGSSIKHLIMRDILYH